MRKGDGILSCSHKQVNPSFEATRSRLIILPRNPGTVSLAEGAAHRVREAICLEQSLAINPNSL
jgi:hypothetical protein